MSKMKLALNKYIGDKDFYKRVFALIIPIMFQQLLISTAGYIDNIMINSYGVSSLAYNGVNAANRLIFVMNFIWMSIATAASIFIAQFFGANNKEKNNETFRLGFLVSVIVGIISMLIITLVGNKVVDSYLVSEESREYGYQYLKYIKYGSVITILNIFFANAFRSIKKPNISLLASSIGIVINIFFNYCLIYGNLGFTELGVPGAAIATIISRIVELLIFIYFLFIKKNSFFKKAFKHLFITKTLFFDFVKKSIPLILNELCWSLGMVLLAKYYTYHNDTWYSAYGYSQNISDLFFIVFAGLGSSTAVIIGESLGRSDFEKAESDYYCFKGLAVILGFTLGMLMFIFSPLIVLVFKPNEEVKALTISLLRITGVFTAVYCYTSVSFFTMRAGGDNIRAFFLDETPTYAVSLPITIILGINAQKLGINIILIYLCSHLGDFLKIFLADFFVKKKKWLVNLTTKHQVK